MYIKPYTAVLFILHLSFRDYSYPGPLQAEHRKNKGPVSSSRDILGLLRCVDLNPTREWGRVWHFGRFSDFWAIVYVTTMGIYSFHFIFHFLFHLTLHYLPGGVQAVQVTKICGSFWNSQPQEPESSLGFQIGSDPGAPCL